MIGDKQTDKIAAQKSGLKSNFRKYMHTLLYLACLVALCALAQANEAKRFEMHTAVPIVANTVGPFNNPTETYPYYSLPFCMHSGKQKRHKQDLGEVLSRSRKHSTPYEVTFMDPVPWRALCEDYLDASQVRPLLVK